jgi:molecular chaperone GrpE (heat shock protein)
MFRKLRRAEAAGPHKDSEEEKKPAAKAAAKTAKPAAGEKPPAVEKPAPWVEKAAPAGIPAAPAGGKAMPAASKAAPAGEKPAPAVSKAAPAGGESAPQEKPQQLLVDLEARVVRAMGLLEKQVGALSASLAKPQAQPAPEPRADTSRDYLDEITAAFRRAVGEALDRKLEEFLAPLVGLHGKLGEELRLLEEDSRGPKHADLKAALAGAVSELEKILRAFGGSFIAPKAGEYYDPLIHLAVAEEPSSGGAESVVARVLRPGYKTVLPAKVLVARR